MAAAIRHHFVAVCQVAAAEHAEDIRRAECGGVLQFGFCAQHFRALVAQLDEQVASIFSATAFGFRGEIARASSEHDVEPRAVHQLSGDVPDLVAPALVSVESGGAGVGEIASGHKSHRAPFRLRRLKNGADWFPLIHRDAAVVRLHARGKRGRGGRVVGHGEITGVIPQQCQVGK